MSGTAGLGYLQQSRLTRSGYPTLLLWNDFSTPGVAVTDGRHALGFVPIR